MSAVIKTENECRLIYADIVRGYSCDVSGKHVIKHYGDVDTTETERVRLRHLQEAEKNGLSSEPEKLALLDKFGHWTKEDEQRYQNYQDELQSLKHSLPRLVIPAQIEDIKKQIDKKRQDGLEMCKGRQQLLGTTREEYANRRAAQFHILSSFYEDRSLKHPLFSQEDLDDMSDTDLEIFMRIYQEVHEVFTDRNMKRIAVCPFFLNPFLLCEGNAYFFYGKFLIDLTLYQLTLFSRGNYYKSIMDETSKRPPEEFYDDLDKVIQFWDKEYSIILGKRSTPQHPT